MFPETVIPTIAIIGRQNVGKSTLYNRITKTRDALVADIPGLTRDPKIGLGKIGPIEFLVADTGGIEQKKTGKNLIERVAKSAMEIANASELILLVVDSRDGLTPSDREILSEIRKLNKKIILVANKSENINYEFASAEFSTLGINNLHVISAKENIGVQELILEATQKWRNIEHSAELNTKLNSNLSISIIGRPNVGKSTLVNQVVGYERLLTSDEPGTTREDVDVDFKRNDKNYTLIDTAGLRRKSKVTEYAEKLSALKTLKALVRSQITVLVIDAETSITAQDLTLLGYALNNGKALVIAANKWDRLTREQKQHFIDDVDRRFKFVRYSEVVFISAKYRKGLNELFVAIEKTWQSISADIKTSHLSNLLQIATDNHPPPLVRGRRIRLRFAHLESRNPLIILIHGNQVKSVPATYTRYLENFLRSQLKLSGTPIKIVYRQSENPYSRKKNQLTNRQQTKRRRLLKHVRNNK